MWIIKSTIPPFGYVDPGGDPDGVNWCSRLVPVIRCWGDSASMDGENRIVEPALAELVGQVTCTDISILINPEDNLIPYVQCCIDCPKKVGVEAVKQVRSMGVGQAPL